MANPKHADIPLGERHRIVGVMDSLIRKGSASEGYYGDYLSIKDCYLSEWNEFIETMNKYDIQPSQVKQLIILLLEYSKNWSGRLAHQGKAGNCRPNTSGG